MMDTVRGVKWLPPNWLLAVMVGLSGAAGAACSFFCSRGQASAAIGGALLSGFLAGGYILIFHCWRDAWESRPWWMRYLVTDLGGIGCGVLAGVLDAWAYGWLQKAGDIRWIVPMAAGYGWGAFHLLCWLRRRGYWTQVAGLWVWVVILGMVRLWLGQLVRPELLLRCGALVMLHGMMVIPAWAAPLFLLMGRPFAGEADFRSRFRDMLCVTVFWLSAGILLWKILIFA